MPPAFKLSIEIKADPALMDLLTRAMNALGVQALVAAPATATVPETTPAPAPVPEKKPAKERTDHIAKPSAPQGAQVIDFPTPIPAPTPAPTPAQGVVTLEQARDAARTLAAAKGRDAVIVLLAMFGAKSISNLKATDYVGFMNQALARAQE